MSVCENNNVQHHQQQTHAQQQQSTQSIADYLAQLLKDRKQLAAFPNVFNHVERLLDEEIARVRASLFQINGVKKEPLMLPEPEGVTVTLNEKVYVPVREHPDFNFVGRILGPRGMTAKQLEQETGCKIMVRGKGSMRDKKKEDANRGKPNWEHLSDELHVLITVEDTENRAKIKLGQAVAEVQKLLVPQAEGEDELKKRQLMELAIINGTYRDTTAKSVAAACEEEWRRVVAASAENRLLTPALPGLATQIRAQTAAPLGAPLILPQRMTVPTTATSLLSGQPAPAGFENAHGMIFTPYGDYANYAALTGNPLLTEYADHSVPPPSAQQLSLPSRPPIIAMQPSTVPLVFQPAPSQLQIQLSIPYLMQQQMWELRQQVEGFKEVRAKLPWLDPIQQNRASNVDYNDINMILQQQHARSMYQASISFQGLYMNSIEAIADQQ